MADQLHFATTGVRAPDPMEAVRMATPLDWEAAVEKGVDLAQRSERNDMMNAQLEAELEALPLRLEQEAVGRELSIKEAGLRIGEMETMAPIRKEKALAELAQLHADAEWAEETRDREVQKHAIFLRKTAAEENTYRIKNNEKLITAEAEARRLAAVNDAANQKRLANEAAVTQRFVESGIPQEIASNGAQWTVSEIQAMDDLVRINYPGLSPEIEANYQKIKNTALSQIKETYTTKDGTFELDGHGVLQLQSALKRRVIDNPEQFFDKKTLAQRTVAKQNFINTQVAAGASPEVAEAMYVYANRVKGALLESQQNPAGFVESFYERNPGARGNLLSYSPTSPEDAMAHSTALRLTFLQQAADNRQSLQNWEDAAGTVRTVGDRLVTDVRSWVSSRFTTVTGDLVSELDVRINKYREAINTSGNSEERDQFAKRLDKLEKIRSTAVLNPSRLQEVAGVDLFTPFRRYTQGGGVDGIQLSEADRIAAGEEGLKLLDGIAPVTDSKGRTVITKEDVLKVRNENLNQLNQRISQTIEYNNGIFGIPDTPTSGNSTVLPNPQLR